MKSKKKFGAFLLIAVLGLGVTGASFFVMRPLPRTAAVKAVESTSLRSEKLSLEKTSKVPASEPLTTESVVSTVETIQTVSNIIYDIIMKLVGLSGAIVGMIGAWKQVSKKERVPRKPRK